MSQFLLKINNYNHYRALRSLLFIIPIMFFWLAILQFDIAAITIFGIFILFDTVPVIYLHIEYWLVNKDEVYELYDDQIVKKNLKKARFTSLMK